MGDLKENADLRKQVNEIYTPLSVAKEEIWRRWNDKELRKKVKDFLGESVPDFFEKEPRAVLLRYIATPNFEANFFIDLASEVNLKPIYGEFLGDKFCTWNQDKLHLAIMTFFLGVNKQKKNNIIKKKIIDIERNDGKLLNDIKTIWGEKMTDFHHKIFFKCYPNIEKFDAYKFRSDAKNVLNYYKNIFVFFLCYGILFENFIAKNNHNENKFTKEIILPAYIEVTKKFKLKPLVSPIYSIDSEDDKDWMWYPSQVKEKLDILIKNKS